MMAGVNAWAELMKAGIGLVGTSMRTGETMLASTSVIGMRLAVIGDAARNPARGDYAELGRMVPEKISAFSQAGQTLVEEWSALLLDASEQAYHVSSLMLRGRSLSAGDLLSLAEQTSAYGTGMIIRTMSAGELVLAPVHKKATANARRLSRGTQPLPR